MTPTPVNTNYICEHDVTQPFLSRAIVSCKYLATSFRVGEPRRDSHESDRLTREAVRRLMIRASLTSYTEMHCMLSNLLNTVNYGTGPVAIRRPVSLAQRVLCDVMEARVEVK